MLIGVYKDKDKKAHYAVIGSVKDMDKYKTMPYCVAGHGTLELKKKDPKEQVNEPKEGVFYDEADITLTGFKLEMKFMNGTEIKL